MTSFLARRIATFVITLWAASVVVFVAMAVLPGDPALVMLGTEASPDTLAALRSRLGIDQPPVDRYLAWIGGLLTGDLGTSHAYGVPVAGLIGDRLAVTLPLAVLAIGLAAAVAVPLGVLAAERRGRPADFGVMGFAQLGVAVPGFWIGILLILVFSVELGWFPAGGFPGWDAGAAAVLAALALPALALALPEAAILARVTRSATLDTLGEDYVRTARAKGLGRRAVLRRHVLRNALVPMVTILGLQFAFLLAGAIVIESVFTLPGLGRLVVQAIGQRDLVVVQTVVVLMAGLVIAINLAVDLAYAAIDPRPRLGAE